MSTRPTGQCVGGMWIMVGILLSVSVFAWGVQEDLGAFGLQGLPVPKDAVKFVDGVRCGDPNDPHEVIHYGKPSKIENVLGRPARVAGGAWQVFAYKLRIQNPSKPHLLMVTYPDDTYRRVHFRVRNEGGPFLRAAINTIYTAHYKVNTNTWVKFWTPFYIPGGKGDQVTIMFADSRESRNLAPNHQGPREAEPWAVGEILLYEVINPEKLLPPLTIAHPVKPEEERYFGFTGFGYAGAYFKDERNKDYLKQYLRHTGINFLRVAGGQGGPAFGQPSFENELVFLDEMAVRSSFAFFKYFNAFLRDRLKTNSLPQHLIETMPRQIKDAIDSLDGWRKPDNLYEGGSYKAKLMVMPLNWLDPKMGPWIAKLVQHYLQPAAKYKSVYMVQFFGTGGGPEGVPLAIAAFAKAVKSVRDDLVVEVPGMYMNLRAKERSNQPVPYTFDYNRSSGIYEGWPQSMKGVIGSIFGSLWRGFHIPPPGFAILDSKEALAVMQRFEDGWLAQFRISEQNESESPKGIGWINDYYPWSGAAFRINILKIMAANPRYVVLNTGWEFPCGHERDLRMLASAWRAFPWDKVEDLSSTLAPKGSELTVLSCKGRLLLINQNPVKRVVSLPAKSDRIVDAVTGEALKSRNLTLEPFEVRTLLFL